MGDKALITDALAKADAFQREWGEIDIPAEQFELARATLEIIRKEEEALSGIRSALAQGGLRGVVGKLSAEGIDVTKLQTFLQEIHPSTIRTKLGSALMTFSKVRGRELSPLFPCTLLIFGTLPPVSVQHRLLLSHAVCCRSCWIFAVASRALIGPHSKQR